MAVMSHMENRRMRSRQRKRKRRKRRHLDVPWSQPQAATGSCAGPLCFQMLHRLAPSLYNCYVNLHRWPWCLCILRLHGQMCSHLQSFNFFQMKLWRKWQENNLLLIKIKLPTYTKGQSTMSTCFFFGINNESEALSGSRIYVRLFL